MTKQFCLSILLVFSSAAFAMQHNVENPKVTDLENPRQTDISETAHSFTKRQKQVACIACSGCMALTFLSTVAGKILYNYYSNN